MILHRPTNRAITPTPSIALTRSREPTLSLSKDNLHILLVKGDQLALVVSSRTSTVVSAYLYQRQSYTQSPLAYV